MFFRLRPKLIGLPKFQAKRISKMQFLKILPKLEFVIFSQNPKKSKPCSNIPYIRLPGGVIPTKTCATSISFWIPPLFFSTNSGKSSFCIFRRQTLKKIPKSGIDKIWVMLHRIFKLCFFGIYIYIYIYIDYLCLKMYVFCIGKPNMYIFYIHKATP